MNLMNFMGAKAPQPLPDIPKPEPTRPQPLFNVQRFDGAVILKDWAHDFTGISHAIYVGKVSLFKCEDAIGFRPSSHESNWFVRIDGSTMAYNFLGCQVRGVIAFQNGRPEKFGPNTLVVP